MDWHSVKENVHGGELELPCVLATSFTAKATCEYLPICCGGCMAEGITDDGDYLIPDSRCCYFHKQIGEQAVREVADKAIREAGLQPNMKAAASA